VPLFRRREPLHAKLAREGGLGPPPEHPGPHWGEVGIHGISRPREWDAVISVDAPALRGEEARFVVLPEGTLLIEDAVDEGELDTLADALDGAVEAPYRAEARRSGGTIWAVGARRIEVVPVEEDVPGDELTLTVHDGRRELTVDGARSSGGVRSLERWAGGRWEAYALTAERLDGDLWEVRAAPL
jgi:hypothetical protein